MNDNGAFVDNIAAAVPTQILTSHHFARLLLRKQIIPRDMPARNRRTSSHHEVEPSGFDSDGEWEDDLPLEELQFGGQASVNPFHDHTSDEEAEPDRTSHQQRALEALNGAAFTTTDTGKLKGKGKAIERVLLAAGPARGTHRVSHPEDESWAAQGPSAQHPHSVADSMNTPRRFDLYGGKTNAELYAPYQGESPLGTILQAEAEDHNADIARAKASTNNPTRFARPQEPNDVEAQASAATRAPMTFSETLRVGTLNLVAPIGSYFDANPTFRRHALAMAVFSYMGGFVLLLLLVATGTVTKSAYTPAGTVRENETYLPVNHTGVE